MFHSINFENIYELISIFITLEIFILNILNNNNIIILKAVSLL